MPKKADNKGSASVLMPGGWVGEPGESGHALAYEFKRDQEGNLLFLVYNSGAGLENYHETIISEVDNKPRYKTVQCYKIPASKTVDSNTLNFFIAELAKPQIFPVVPKKTDSDTIQYDAKELYEHVFRQIAHLKGEAIEVRDLCLLDPSYNDTVSIGQRSGTCAEKSLHELIKHSIKDKKIGKLIIFSLKLQSTELFLAETRNLEKKSDDYAKNLSQLEFGKKKLAKKLSKIMKDHHNGMLPYEVQAIQARAQKAIEEVEALCHEKNQEIAYLEQSIGKSVLKITDANVWNVELANVIDPAAAKPGRLEKEDQQEKKEQKDYASEACQGTQFSIERFDKFKDSLERLNQEGDSTAVEQQIYFYLTNFPLTVEYLQSIDSPQEAIQYIDGIQYLLDQYTLAAKESKDYRDYNQLTPKMVAAILSVTEAIDLVYQNKKFNFISEEEPSGIEKFFDGTFNAFKKESRLNPYLSTDNPGVDARIQAILRRESTALPPSRILSLESVNEYLNVAKQAGLKIYLQKLYRQNIDRAKPKFSEIEQALISSKNYQAVIAYIHYLELQPGKPPEDFSKDAGNVTLYKKTKYVCQNVFNILHNHQFQEVAKNDLSGKKFVQENDKNTALVENGLISHLKFLLNRERNVAHFNEITSQETKKTLTDQFFYQRANALDDSYAANKIYSGSDSSLLKMLRYLRTDPGVQFQTTINFFQNNLDLFSSKKPEKDTKDVKDKKDTKNEQDEKTKKDEKVEKSDIQQYVRRNIFQTGILIRAIKENENFLEFFHEFIQKAILYYSATENNIDNVLYFYQLQADVDNYVLNMSECPETLKNNVRALQVIMLKELQAMDSSKIKTESDKYRLSKIKLQLELNTAEKNDPEVEKRPSPSSPAKSTRVASPSPSARTSTVVPNVAPTASRPPMPALSTGSPVRKKTPAPPPNKQGETGTDVAKKSPGLKK